MTCQPLHFSCTITMSLLFIWRDFMQKLVGQDIGRYHVIEELGHGGMATVYKAFDTRLERDVAIKLIRREAVTPENLENMLKRFEREAKSLAKMTHPNIVKVHDFGEYEGSPYLVMEFVGGGTLKKQIGRPWHWQEAARMLIPIARALDYAHKSSIVHRDVKPANILVTDTGEPMLSDFGIAKILESTDEAHLTQTGVGVGTPDYMAPEQWLGKVSPQTDIYSLGVVFFEMVTGTRPFIADTPIAVLLKHANDPLPRPREINPDLSEEVERVLYKALAKKPEERYPDMEAFAKALERLAVTPETSAKIKTGEETATQTAPLLPGDVTITQTPQAIPTPAASTRVLVPQADGSIPPTSTARAAPVTPHQPALPPASTTGKKKTGKGSTFTIVGGIVGGLVICAVAIFVIVRLAGGTPLALFNPTDTPTATRAPTHTRVATFTRVPIQAVTDTPEILTSVQATTLPDQSFKACMAGNVTGFDDRSFNSLVWEGFLLAQGKLDIAVAHLVERQI
jgi:serine/threonine protein kinase